MKDVERILMEATETQKNAVNIMLEAQKMKESIEEKTGKTLPRDIQMTMIPFAAYELQQERNEAEKDKIRKRYKDAIISVCVTFAIFIVSVFGIATYLLHNFEFCSCVQDGSGLNNYLSENAQQGDLNYESSNTSDAPQKGKVETKGNCD